MLNPNNAERLVKILGRLGSDFPGERDTAARMATRMLQDLSLSWQQVIVAYAPSLIPKSNQRSGDVATDWHRMAIYCFNRRFYLSAVEQKFARDMVERTRGAAPTERQQDWLAAIYSRLYRRFGARVQS